jgi:hypothetical protein
MAVAADGVRALAADGGARGARAVWQLLCSGLSDFILPLEAEGAGAAGARSLAEARALRAPGSRAAPAQRCGGPCPAWAAPAAGPLLTRRAHR